VSISVIVPTKNEADNIRGLLRTIPTDIELVVCDASTDPTVDVALELRPDRTIVVHAPGTIAEARQRGAHVASGDVLVFSDADVEFDAS
jgi:glycosyltransferase involved in cell wall biosynthesis